MGFSSPKAPKLPAPPPLPTPVEIDTAALARQQTSTEKRRRGRNSLVISPDPGVSTGTANTGLSIQRPY